MYLKYLKIHFKSLAQFRASFWMVTFGQFFVSFFYFIGLYLLFLRFGTVSGWTFAEAALCFGVATFSFSIAECVARGFDVFSRQIVTGDFDRLLVRPRGTILQIFGSIFEFSRLGRFVQSIAVLIYALTRPGIVWNAAKAVTLCGMLLSGTAVFISLFIMGATLCFFTIDGIEVINIFTDGGKEIAQYPLPIYEKWVRRFFTFVIPFGCFNYLPLMFITDRIQGNSIFYMLTPLAGIFFLIPSVLIWRFGVRHYLSTGS